MGFCLLEMTQRSQDDAEGSMRLSEVWALLYRDAGCLKGFLVPSLFAQGIA